MKILSLLFLSIIATILFLLVDDGVRAAQEVVLVQLTHRHGARTPIVPDAIAQEVVLVQLPHRHGARTPIVPDAIAQEVCGNVGCGELNYAGEMMLTALGNYLYDRYATGS